MLLGAIALLAAPGLLLWLAARLAGGSPQPDVWDWPARAAEAELDQRPFAPWTWVGAGHVASPALFYAVCVLSMLLLGGVALWAGYALAGGISAWFPGLFGRHGEPRPAARTELGRLTVRGPRPGRMIVGHSGALVATEPGCPLLVFGAPGSGKTAAYCVPIVQEWSGPVVAASTKPDLVDATAGVRQHLGWVEICDQSGATGLATRSWSPEAGCDDFDAALRRAGWMVRGLAGAGDGGDAATRAVLSVALWAAAGGVATFAELSDCLRTADGVRLRQIAGRVPQPDPRVQRALTALAGLAPAAREECCRAVARVLEATAEEGAHAQANGAPLHPGEMVPRGDGALYLVAREAEPDRPSPWACGALGSVLDEAFRAAAAGPGQVLDRPLLVVFDGVVPSTLLGELAQYLALAGAVNITLLITFTGQGEDWSGDAAEEFLGGVGAIVFLGGQQDDAVLRLAAELAPALVSAGDGPAGLELAGLLGPGQGVLLHEGLPPVALWAQPWFQIRRLARLQATRPYVKGVGRVG